MDSVVEPSLVRASFTRHTASHRWLGLPPILNFGKPHIRNKIVPEVLAGKKLVCLAITEAFAGSDVAGLRCHAKKVDGGYLVNGTCVPLAY